MNKLTDDFQKQFSEKQFLYEGYCKVISPNVKLHEEINHPRSSAAACLNVFQYLNQHQEDIIPFFKKIGLKIGK